MNNFNHKSINYAYKHMILSVTHSPQSICTSLLAAEITLINQQFATVCQFNSCTVYSKDGSTIALSV